MLLDISYALSPTVPSCGYVTFVFSKFERVTHALISFDQSVNVSGDTSGGIDISFNWGVDASLNNAVQLFPTVRAQPNGNRRAAVTADLNGKKFVVLATGI